jgi:hypothetical protein
MKQKQKRQDFEYFKLKLQITGKGLAEPIRLKYIDAKEVWRLNFV